jgi:hypothetical protein
LLAAHAAELSGHQPFIFSKREKSPITGAQFIHEPIPELTKVGADAYVRFKKFGTKEGYAEKVYGDKGAPCSWEEFAEGEMPMWSLHQAYDLLWERYYSRITNMIVGKAVAKSLVGTYERKGDWSKRHSHEVPERIGDFEKLFQNSYDLIISTIPAFVLCEDPDKHEFPSADIWIRRESIMLSKSDDPCIIYNGDPDSPWYRTSLILGAGSTEFAHQVSSAEPGQKPLDTNCDCQKGILRVGRFGRWKKGVLLHHAFKESLDALQQNK